jgi:hypothetical protein
MVLAKPRHRAIENRDVGAQANCHVRRIQAGYAAANDYDFARCDTRYATQQYAASAVRFLQCERASLDGQPAGHFAHRRQQRQ